MAKRIKDTPIIRGKDAERFLKALSESELRKVPDADCRKALDVFEKVRQKNKGLL